METTKEISNLDLYSLTNEAYPIEVGFMITLEGRIRYAERQAFRKGFLRAMEYLQTNKNQQL